MSLLSPQLTAFMAVVKAKTVHGAAESLHLTQTAVTQRIKTLEQSLNTALFKRSRRGMALTPEGEALWRYCQNALMLANETLTYLKNPGETAPVELTLCGPTSMMHSRILQQVMPLMRQFPKLFIHFDINDAETGHQALKAGRADLAIIHETHIAKEMKTKALKAEEYVLVASREMASRSLNDIIEQEAIIDFGPEDEVTFNYLKHYQLFEKARRVRHYVNHTEMMATLIKSGIGYGVLTREFVDMPENREALCVLNDGKIYEHHLVLAWYDRPNAAAYFQALIAAIH